MAKNRLCLRADRELQKEMEDQVDIVYGATAIALHRYYGWGRGRIMSLFEMTRQIWNTCAKDPDMSMLRMLEEETGIEIQARGCDRSYHDLLYLNGLSANARDMKPAEYIYMRRRQKPWVNPQITAAMLLALHRKCGWGGLRDQTLLNLKDDVENSLDHNHKAILEAARDEIGIDIFMENRKNG